MKAPGRVLLKSKTVTKYAKIKKDLIDLIYMSNDTENEVVDFSNYYNPPAEKSEKADPVSPIQPLESLPVQKSTSIKWLIGVLLVLVIAQVVVYFITKKPSSSIPEGYRLIYPTNAPPRLEKIK